MNILLPNWLVSILLLILPWRASMHLLIWQGEIAMNRLSTEMRGLRELLDSGKPIRTPVDDAEYARLKQELNSLK